MFGQSANLLYYDEKFITLFFCLLFFCCCCFVFNAYFTCTCLWNLSSYYYWMGQFYFLCSESMTWGSFFLSPTQFDKCVNSVGKYPIWSVCGKLVIRVFFLQGSWQEESWKDQLIATLSSGTVQGNCLAGLPCISKPFAVVILTLHFVYLKCCNWWLRGRNTKSAHLVFNTFSDIICEIYSLVLWTNKAGQNPFFPLEPHSFTCLRCNISKYQLLDAVFNCTLLPEQKILYDC